MVLNDKMVTAWKRTPELDSSRRVNVIVGQLQTGCIHFRNVRRAFKSPNSANI